MNQKTIIYVTLDHFGPLTCGFTVSAQKKILVPKQVRWVYSNSRQAGHDERETPKRVRTCKQNLRPRGYANAGTLSTEYLILCHLARHRA